MVRSNSSAAPSFQVEHAEMFVVACLGNPGKKYARNRHNIGYIIGEHLAARKGVTIGSTPFGARACRCVEDGKEMLLIFPQEYMNCSGVAVRKVLDYYRVPAERLIAVHDDIELPFGEIRVKFNGGHKGHNGIRSIAAELGTAGFHRLRFGVGRPSDERQSVADHVLSDFTSEEYEAIRGMLPAAAERIVSLVSEIGVS